MSLKPLDPVGVDELERASQEHRLDGRSASILQSEQGAIDSRRRQYGLDELAKNEGLVGLALSGGGIRSATFNLGVLQALAARDRLRHVDYLSTVSGGGYIGTSLLWWLSGLAGTKLPEFGLGPSDLCARHGRWLGGASPPVSWSWRAK